MAEKMKLRELSWNRYNGCMGLQGDVDMEIYEGNPCEATGRLVINSFGITESVILPRVYWSYLDWMVEQGTKFQNIIAVCEEKRRDEHLADVLFAFVYLEYQGRREEGSPLPPWVL